MKDEQERQTLHAATSTAGISTQQGVPTGGGAHFSASDMAVTLNEKIESLV
jgi:hypothetical protein